MKKRKIIIIFLFVLIFSYKVSGVKYDRVAAINAISSSYESTSLTPDKTIDGNKNTRWSSEFSDNQWLKFDLGQVKEIVGLTLYWEFAYGKSYDILLSSTGERWVKVYGTTDGDGSIDDIYFGKKRARYIKILCKERGTQYGYSLWEVEFKGTGEEILLTSSSASKNQTAEKAIDGNIETLWHSKKTGKAWIRFELQKQYNWGGLTIIWGDDYPVSYSIDISSDGKNWQMIYNETKSDSGTDEIVLNIFDVQYMRINCKKSKTKKGFAIKEIYMKKWNEIAKHSSFEMVRGLTGWENCKFKTFVGKDGSLGPDPHHFRISFWLYDNKLNKLWTPETLKTSWSLLKGRLPINVINWKIDKFKVTTTIFARWINQINQMINFVKINIKNKTATKKDISLFVMITPNPIRTKKIKKIEYDGNKVVKVNNRIGLFLKKKSNNSSLNRNIISKIEEFGDFKLLGADNKIIYNSAGAIGYRKTLKSSEEATYYFFVPTQNIGDKTFITKLDFSSSYNATIKYWERRVPMKLKLPDKRYSDCFYSSIYYLLILMENNKLYPGPLAYRNFFLHDAVDMVNAIDKVGLGSIAENALKYFDYKEGDNYLDGLGGNIFVLFEHYRITKNKTFLRKVYPKIVEKCKLIKKLRAKQIRPDLQNTPFYGLLPKSVSQDNFTIPAYLYIDNWWALIGLKAGMGSAQVLNKRFDFLWMKEEYEQFLKAVLESIKKVMRRDNISYIPAFADYWSLEMRVMDNEHRILGDTQMAWAHRSAIFPGLSIGLKLPLNLFAKSYQHYWKNAGKFSGYDGGWYVEYEKFFWGYNVMISHPLRYLGMEDIALKNIQWNIEHQSCPGGWMEAMNTRVNEKGLREIAEGIVGDVPHGWVAAHYILFLRDMLLREVNNKIIILPCIPEDWVNSNKIIEIKNAPTYFGELNYTVKKEKSSLKIEISGAATPPKGFVFRFPFLKKKIKSVKIQGKKWEKFSDNEVLFDKLPAKIVVGY